MASNASTYLKNAIANWFKGSAFPAAPANVYVSLHSADPGATGANELASGTSPGYARVAVATASGWSAIADSDGGRLIENDANITFPMPTGNGATATHWGIWDAASGGNFLIGGSLDASFTWTSGEQRYIPAAVLDLIFGPTTV